MRMLPNEILTEPIMESVPIDIIEKPVLMGECNFYLCKPEEQPERIRCVMAFAVEGQRVGLAALFFGGWNLDLEGERELTFLVAKEDLYPTDRMIFKGCNFRYRVVGGGTGEAEAMILLEGKYREMTHEAAPASYENRTCDGAVHPDLKPRAEREVSTRREWWRNRMIRVQVSISEKLHMIAARTEQPARDDTDLKRLLSFLRESSPEN